MSGSRSSSGSSRTVLLLLLLGAVVAAIWFLRARSAANAPDAQPKLDPIGRSLERLRQRGPLTEVDRAKVARFLEVLSASSATVDPDEPDAAPPPDAAPGPDAAYSDAELRKAEDLYNEGAGAFRDGDYDHAAQTFLDAYEIARFPLLIFNASLSLAKLGRCAEAIEVMRWYLDEVANERDKRLGEEKLAELSASCP